MISMKILQVLQILQILQILRASWSRRVHSWLRRSGNGSNQLKSNHETVHQMGLQMVVP